jgi:hypothetical protein
LLLNIVNEKYCVNSKQKVEVFMIQTSPSFQALSPSLISHAWRINKPLTALVAFCVVLIILSAIGLVFDPRATLFIGTPTWAKSFKFSISVALYASGLLWAIRFAQGRMRSVSNVAASFIGLNLIFEMVLLVIQAVRAHPLHFNQSSLFDLVIWRTMTIGIVSMLIGYVILVLSTWRGIRAQPVLAWAVRLGLLVTLIGMVQGFIMPKPTSAQREALKSGQTLQIMGAHTVGSSSIMPDAGPGLPLLGWSTTHGDLRIGHFVGLHALQILPFFAFFLIGRRERWLLQAHRIALIWIATLTYAGLMWLVTWQALRGQPLLQPDTTTLIALASVLGFGIVSSLLVVVQARVSHRKVSA